MQWTNSTLEVSQPRSSICLRTATQPLLLLSTRRQKERQTDGKGEGNLQSLEVSVLCQPLRLLTNQPLPQAVGLTHHHLGFLTSFCQGSCRHQVFFQPSLVSSTSTLPPLAQNHYLWKWMKLLLLQAMPPPHGSSLVLPTSSLLG